MDWSRVTQAIATAEATGATLGVGIIAPSGARFSHNGTRPFVAASTVKLAIMIELFRRVDAGTIDLAWRHTFAETDKTQGSGVLMHLGVGLSLSLADLAYLMMSISDNAATNILIDTVGLDQVNACMRSLGMPDSRLGRKMRGRPVLPGENENLAVPDEYATLIAALFNGQAASPASCAAMQALLEKQQNDRRIARLLPRENRPRWGSKTGSLTGAVNDVGFIMTPAGPLCIAVFVKDPTDPLEGEAIIGAIAAAAL
jgi:beta-lactamase class A